MNIRHFLISAALLVLGLTAVTTAAYSADTGSPAVVFALSFVGSGLCAFAVSKAADGGYAAGYETGVEDGFARAKAADAIDRILAQAREVVERNDEEVGA